MADFRLVCFGTLQGGGGGLHTIHCPRGNTAMLCMYGTMPSIYRARCDIYLLVKVKLMSW